MVPVYTPFMAAPRYPNSDTEPPVSAIRHGG